MPAPSQDSDSGSCGSDTAPWLISAHPGQRVRVTLLDFDVAIQHARSSSLNVNETETALEPSSCTSTSWGQTVYAVINDATGSADHQNVTVCGGWMSSVGEARTSARSRVVFESVGHVVEVRMPMIGQQRAAVPRQRRTSFVLRISGQSSLCRPIGFNKVYSVLCECKLYTMFKGTDFMTTIDGVF